MKFCHTCGSVLSLCGDLNSQQLSKLTKKKKILLATSNPMEYFCECCEEKSDESIDTLILQQTFNTKECDTFFKTILSPYLLLDNTYPMLDKNTNIFCPDCQSNKIKYVTYEDHYWMSIYICCDCYCGWYLRNGLLGQTLEKVDIFM